ncbi:restriction endonuclease subunit S [Methanochimaera problematica]|uniref:restriction endonuclease subunit S n=1 Tax=Methanochimaera problematica TaxID=2609417 RepID=UPI002939244F|nr:restriction endonuclease subunit S [Methanoplanus sp. FWC-SCC4]
MKKELPEGWEWKQLGDIGKIFSGSTPSTKVEENFNGDIPWITPADLSNFDEMYIQKGKKNISEKGLKSTSIKILPKGTVLFSSRAPVGYVAIADNPITTNQGFKNLVLNDDRIIPEYVFYYLKANKKLAEKYASGTTFLEVSSTRFSQIPIVIPPLETQRKIVAILEKAEATQRLRAEADALTQELVQSVFLEMFGDPVTNPMGWESVKLSQICEKITDGEHATPRRTDDGIYLLSARNIKNHKIDVNDVDFIDQEEYERISKRIVPQKGDVLVSCSGTIGRVTRVMNDIKFQMVRSVALIRPDFAKVHPIYLEYCFDSPFVKAQINRSVNKSSQANLFQGKIKEIEVFLPPLNKQLEFAQFIELYENTLIKINKSTNDDSLLFKSIISKAFTGELIT